MKKNYKKIIVFNPRKAGQNTARLNEALHTFKAFDWKVIREALRKHREKMFEHHFYGARNIHSEKQFQQDMDQLELIIMNISRIINLIEPPVKHEKFI